MGSRVPPQQSDPLSADEGAEASRRTRRPSFGLCCWEFGLLLALSRKKEVGAARTRILNDLRAPFLGRKDWDPQIASQIAQNSHNFYVGFDKLVYDIHPALIREVRNGGKNPLYYITEAGFMVVTRTIARVPEAESITWLMRKHQENRASKKHTRLVTSGHLEAMMLQLKTIRR